MKKIIRFTAPWCAPCKQLTIALESLEVNVPIDTIDIDTDPDAAIKYNVRGLPTLIKIEDGKETSRQIGLKSTEALKKWIET